MAKQSLADFGNSSSDFLKLLAVAEAKVGKTTYLAASALGALPHQTKGLVDKAENLHILGFDEAFVDGLLRFIRESCKKGPEFCKVSVHDLTEIARKSGQGADWDFTLNNAVTAEIQAIKADIAKGGVHCVIVSSLTGLSTGLQNGLAGPPNPAKKGGGMDQSKWQDLSRQISQARNLLQSDTHHTIWEGHVMKGGGADEKETMHVTGSAGKAFGFNVEQVVRLRREMTKYPNTTVDKVYMDTRPTLDFVAGGRGFNEALQPKEYCLVEFAEKLGKKVGGFK